MKQYLALSLVGSFLLSSTAFAADTTFSAKAFTDVSVNSQYYEAIEFLRTKNVVKGYLDGTFKPDTRINRAEFAQLVVSPLLLDTNNLAECVSSNVPETTDEVFFSDVHKDAWYAMSVCFAKIKGLIHGYPNGTYRPADPINFVESAKIIANVFSLELATEPTGEFWYRAYVQYLSDHKAIPVSITRFDQTITRGEMAEMIFRLKEAREDKASANISVIK